MSCLHLALPLAEAKLSKEKTSVIRGGIFSVRQQSVRVDDAHRATPLL
jgi:hypothetical protein